MANLLLFPEAFEDPIWGSGGSVTVTPNTTPAPNSTTTADTLTTASGSHAMSQTVEVTASTQYTFSFYAQRGTATDVKLSVYNWSGGADIVTPTSYYSSIVAGSMTRVNVVFTTPAGCTSIGVYPLRDSGVPGSVIVWGAWLNTGSTPDPYPGVGEPDVKRGRVNIGRQPRRRCVQSLFERNPVTLFDRALPYGPAGGPPLITGSSSATSGAALSSSGIKRATGASSAAVGGDVQAGGVERSLTGTEAAVGAALSTAGIKRATGASSAAAGGDVQAGGVERSLTGTQAAAGASLSTTGIKRATGASSAAVGGVDQSQGTAAQPTQNGTEAAAGAALSAAGIKRATGASGAAAGGDVESGGVERSLTGTEAAAGAALSASGIKRATGASNSAAGAADQAQGVAATASQHSGSVAGGVSNQTAGIKRAASAAHAQGGVQQQVGASTHRGGGASALGGASQQAIGVATMPADVVAGASVSAGAGCESAGTQGPARQVQAGGRSSAVRRVHRGKVGVPQPALPIIEPTPLAPAVAHGAQQAASALCETRGIKRAAAQAIEHARITAQAVVRRPAVDALGDRIVALERQIAALTGEYTRCLDRLRELEDERDYRQIVASRTGVGAI